MVRPKNLSADLKVRATIHLAKTWSRSENLSPFFFRIDLCSTDLSLRVKSGFILDASWLSLFRFANIFCHYFFPNHSCKFTFVSGFLSEVFNATRLNKIPTAVSRYFSSELNIRPFFICIRRLWYLISTKPRSN